MLIASSALLSVAVACWPLRPAAARLRRLTDSPRPHARRVPRPAARACAVLAAVALWLLTGPAAAVSALVLAGTVVRASRSSRARKRRHAADDALAEALASLVAELRGGSHPAAAARRAAADCAPLAAPAMQAVAGALALGGSVTRAVERSALGMPSLSDPLARFARAWELAERHGLPLAEVLEAVRDDLRARSRFAGQVHARMAGPRSSAVVLAVLPVVGVLLGEAMGAGPLTVLLGGGAGGILLVLGCCLTAAGLFWIGRLTGKVVTLA